MNTPVHPQIQRTLAAIVVTDAVGFSKRMSQDEDKALGVINRDLQIIEELCEFFEGKILKTVGDGVLMYFISAVQAAACAVELQKTFLGFANTKEEDEHFIHRVGVHLGDIFFNQQDMMGTGVNIAARLESTCKPGAVCMSQVVYDVVKSRLELDADYLGELALKGIGETVSAYNVWPRGMRPERNKEDSTEAVAPLTITPINLALKKLSSHPNHRRVKKLLYGVHQTFWENDTSVLEGFSFKMLLESLTDRNSNLEDCRKSLYQIVSTLNRQKEYGRIAEVILESIHPIYIEATGGTFPSELENDSAETEASDDIFLENPIVALYRDIAIRLEQTGETVRMKKMLYCLCYNSWENDTNRVSALPTVTLVEELYQQIDSTESLQNRLRAILMRLNRRAKYSPIANHIFKECQALYPDIDSEISMPGMGDEDESTSENTQINVRKKSEPTPPPVTRWPTKADQENLSPRAIQSAAFSN